MKSILDWWPTNVLQVHIELLFHTSCSICQIVVKRPAANGPLSVLELKQFARYLRNPPNGKIAYFHNFAPSWAFARYAFHRA